MSEGVGFIEYHLSSVGTGMMDFLLYRELIWQRSRASGLDKTVRAAWTPRERGLGELEPGAYSWGGGQRGHVPP